MSLFGYSQPGRIVLQGSDTLALIPIQSVRAANALQSDFQYLKTENEILNLRLLERSKQLDIRNDQIETLQNGIDIKKSIIDSKDEIISTRDGEIIHLRKEVKKHKSKSRLIMIGAGALVIASLFTG